MGVVRTAPDEAAFSPIKLGGIGLQRTEANQTIDHIKMIMIHGHRNTVTGILLRNTIEQIAIESGLEGKPFEYEPAHLTYTTENTWIQNTITTCNTYHVNIEPRFQGIPNWTTRDDYIMDKTVVALKGRELTIFNIVRLYLRVATVSDLSTTDGRRIDTNIMTGIRGTSPSPSRWAYSWPNIPVPTHSEKKLWTLSLGRIFGVTEANPSLDTTNYRWFHPECIDLACWNINLSTGDILQEAKLRWIIWEPDTNSMRMTRRRTL